MSVAAVLLGAYLTGSMNFAIAVSRLVGFPDPRTQKSGNPGASNVARVAGRGWATAVLLLDLARAIFIRGLAARFCPVEAAPWAGLALIAGNRFPIFHKFKGGKGVAAYLGFVAATQPWFALLACTGWFGTYSVTRVSALASMTMLLVLAVAAIRELPVAFLSMLGTSLTVALIVAGHRSNLRAWRRHQSHD